MARTLNQLTAREVASLKQPGQHADGGDLYLRITTAGGRSWVFMTTSNGKRTEIGIGAAASVSLATARRIAGEMREAVAMGKSPRSVLALAEPEGVLTVPTFGAFADEYISSVEEGWKIPFTASSGATACAITPADCETYPSPTSARRRFWPCCSQFGSPRRRRPSG